ncbi:hypothetical protein GJ496_003883 [Pomphorhynchus laevis]|nr:hypothetical protein GJ496_003883 [Pomphorhynchus laevis]
MQYTVHHGYSPLLNSIISRRNAPPLENLHAIRDIQLTTKNASLQVIVLKPGRILRTREGREMRTIRVADPSGSILFALWNAPCAHIKSGDILQLTGVGSTVWKGSMQLKLSPKGTITKCGSFCMLFSHKPDHSVLPVEVAQKYIEQHQMKIHGHPANPMAGQYVSGQQHIEAAINIADPTADSRLVHAKPNHQISEPSAYVDITGGSLPTNADSNRSTNVSSAQMSFASSFAAHYLPRGGQHGSRSTSENNNDIGGHKKTNFRNKRRPQQKPFQKNPAGNQFKHG